MYIITTVPDIGGRYLLLLDVAGSHVHLLFKNDEESKMLSRSRRKDESESTTFRPAIDPCFQRVQSSLSFLYTFLYSFSLGKECTLTICGINLLGN